MNKGTLLMAVACLSGAIYLSNQTPIPLETEVMASTNADLLEDYNHMDDLYAFLQRDTPNQTVNEIPVEPDSNSLSETKTGAVSSGSLKQKFDVQKAVNGDTVGWLSISELGIDEPIMLAADNQYYLERNPKGNYDKNGSVFMDAGLKGEYGKIVLLHGHNMRNGKIFGKLSRLTKKEVFDKQPIVNVYDGEQTRKYIPFSVFYIDANKEQIPLSFQYLSGYTDYFEQLKNRSLHSLVDIEPNEVLLLQTCAYVYSPDSGKDGRLIIACYRGN